jgi:hypothetical protein
MAARFFEAPITDDELHLPISAEARERMQASKNLLALGDAIEAALQENVANDEPHTIALDAPTQTAFKPQRVLTTQPLKVQSSHKPAPASGVVLVASAAQPQAAQQNAQPAASARVAPASHLVAPIVPAAPVAPVAIAMKQETSPKAEAHTGLRMKKPSSKAPWLIAAAVVIASLGSVGYLERGRIAQMRAAHGAPKAVAVQPAAEAKVEPVIAAALAAPTQPAAAAGAPVAAVAAQPVIAAAAQPVAAADDHAKSDATASTHHRDRHRAKAKDTDDTATTTKAAEAKPAEAKPAEAKPTEAKPAEAKPAEAKPAEAKVAKADPSPAAKQKADDEELKKASEALLKAQLDSAL